ncbi:hypothetical protein CEUSTIGMA_g8190.t1 [Chlamydomonas eustigma]|uniref:Thioredoxin domain-containing protein n=1 Tax=Chlamydomonas eustigma TaxID=1157962 RepID=A0A250XCD5_9CHLO|nr:hypothetical protein CEUSTIGMA_g8190.t1 [Chlamydomonas eustigma]|eukprot:GAX80755.1 hypothetical protein CEUSTIGMA_g8190.t1 [Chlamydomonas eustigma]
MAHQQIIEQAIGMVAAQLEKQIDDEINHLDNLGEQDVAQIRMQRMAELKKKQEKSKEWLARGHGEYSEILSEKEFFDSMKGEERMICHFYRENWPCKVMDKHLGLLAKSHIETKFVKINAEKSPFLTEKLKIWMLPTLALIKNEKVEDYVVGFDAVGGKDDFESDVLATHLSNQGIIDLEYPARRPPAGAGAPGQTKNVRKGGFQKTGSDEDSDFD